MSTYDKFRSLCKYPYTFQQKMDFYSQEMYCSWLWVIGTGLYSKFIQRKPLLTDTILKEMSQNELEKNKDTNKRKILYHSGIIVVFCGISYCCHRLSNDNQTNKTLIIAPLICAATITINSFYNLISSMFNIIKINVHCQKNSHELEIVRILHAVTKQFNESNFKINDRQISTIHIMEKLDSRKIEWSVSKKEYEPKKHTYVVYNGYYENLFFVFNVQDIANDFLMELKKMPIYQIDELAKNPKLVNVIQQDFIKDHFLKKLTISYFENHNIF